MPTSDVEFQKRLERNNLVNGNGVLFTPGWAKPVDGHEIIGSPWDDQSLVTIVRHASDTMMYPNKVEMINLEKKNGK